MCEVIICACHVSSIERFLLDTPGLGERLMSYVVEETAKLCPMRIRAITLPWRTKLFKKLNIVHQVIDRPFQGPSGNFVEKFWSFVDTPSVPEKKCGEKEIIIVVAPGLGPISHSRMRDVLNAAQKDNRHDLFLSAIPVPVNCNPAWLHAVPRAVTSSGNFRLPADTETHRNDSICCMDGRRVLPEGRPLGSQWLPEFWHFDGAVASMGSGGDIGRVPRKSHILSRLEDEWPLLYGLPIFQLGEEADIEWPLTRENIPTLFKSTSFNMVIDR